MDISAWLRLKSVPSFSTVFFLVILCVFFLIFFLLFLYARSHAQAEQEYINTLEATNELQRKFYEELLHSNHQIHLLRHDMRNHLQTVRLLLVHKPERAQTYLQKLESSLQIQCKTDSGTSVLEYFLTYRRQLADKNCLTLCITIPTFGTASTEEVSYILLVLHALDLAIVNAVPGSQIILSPFSDSSIGFYLRFDGPLSRNTFRSWKQVNEPLCGKSGKITPHLRKSTTEILVFCS